MKPEIRSRRRLVLLWLLFAGAVGLADYFRPGPEAVRSPDFLVYDADGATVPILLPDVPTDIEREAGRLVAETLAVAAGTHPQRFPVRREKDWRPGMRAIFLGATRRAAQLPALAGESRLERPVAWTVSPDGVTVRARWPEDIALAASWFLEQTVGARWFLPGPLGREVEARPALRLRYGDHTVQPDYFSRALGGMDRPEEEVWLRNNRLLTLVWHGHTAAAIYTAADLAARPDLAPVYRGRRYQLRAPGDRHWQPNFAQAAAEFAATKARAAFAAAPESLYFTIGQNDTIRFDQSPATLAAVAPAQYFRGKPDYANLLFSFLNRVAADVAKDYPDRFLTTYSYDWTENAPRLKVAPMVFPYLTADRSNWFDEEFAEGDRALMRRWHETGVRYFGLYDYYYGGPFFMPRPTLYAVTRPIPFAYATGARAFYAECNPNWGLDGPKYWLAAQLLWDARANPAALLEKYYRKFWREAAGPMRRYLEICDRQWLAQPKPAAWIKYFKDDQQRLLFPAPVRRELRACLEEAAKSAREPVVRQRVRLFRAGFELTEAFCRFDERREELHRLVLGPPPGSAALLDAGREYAAARATLQQTYLTTRRVAPLAVKSELTETFLRDDPRRAAAGLLARNPDRFGEIEAKDLQELFDGRAPTAAELDAVGTEELKDAGLTTLRRRAGPAFTLLEWAEDGTPWRAEGEPYATRQIGLLPRSDGTQALRYAGCNQDSLFQWVPARPGALYAAAVQVRARVSPANMTFLMLSFADKDGRLIGEGHVDRLPVGEWGAGTKLQLLARAPEKAAYLGLGLIAFWQVNDDFAEYEQISLRRLP